MSSTWNTDTVAAINDADRHAADAEKTRSDGHDRSDRTGYAGIALVHQGEALRQEVRALRLELVDALGLIREALEALDRG